MTEKIYYGTIVRDKNYLFLAIYHSYACIYMYE